MSGALTEPVMFACQVFWCLRVASVRMTTLGIDFGRFSSSVAVHKEGRGEVVADSQGHRFDAPRSSNLTL